jgi:ABC-type Na+ transport system ATPase subunit NatA
MPYMGLHSAGFVAKIFASLLSPVAFALSGHTILRLEEIFTGLRMDSWLEPIDDFPFGVGTAMMLLDSVIYLGLAWYLDQVVPSEHRTSKALCFPCRQGPRRTLSGEGELKLSEHGKDASAPNAGVTVRGLRKVYGAGSCEGEAHVAVEGLDLDMTVGQIFVLLGHNGAGKTTTINMLTGETAITAGSAEIFGLDVGESAASVRRVLGACSQQDILVPTLTVAEHLALWARLKGVLDKDLMRLVQTAIEEVDLTLAAHQHAASLSGGQKRRLSLAMALIGNPKVIFLDEPTSGCDPVLHCHMHAHTHTQHTYIHTYIHTFIHALILAYAQRHKHEPQSLTLVTGLAA